MAHGSILVERTVTAVRWCGRCGRFVDDNSLESLAVELGGRNQGCCYVLCDGYLRVYDWFGFVGRCRSSVVGIGRNHGHQTPGETHT